MTLLNKLSMRFSMFPQKFLVSKEGKELTEKCRAMLLEKEGKDAVDTFNRNLRAHELLGKLPF